MVIGRTYTYYIYSARVPTTLLALITWILVFFKVVEKRKPLQPRPWFFESIAEQWRVLGGIERGEKHGPLTGHPKNPPIYLRFYVYYLSSSQNVSIYLCIINTLYVSVTCVLARLKLQLESYDDRVHCG